MVTAWACRTADSVCCIACRTSKDLKAETDEDLQPSSTETSMSSAAGPHLKDGPGAPRQLIQELIEENSKLFEENKKLGARYPTGPAGSASSTGLIAPAVLVCNVHVQQALWLATPVSQHACAQSAPTAECVCLCSTLSIKELADANQKLQEENQKLQSG